MILSRPSVSDSIFQSDFLETMRMISQTSIHCRIHPIQTLDHALPATDRIVHTHSDDDRPRRQLALLRVKKALSSDFPDIDAFGADELSDQLTAEGLSSHWRDSLDSPMILGATPRNHVVAKSSFFDSRPPIDQKRRNNQMREK